MLRDPIRELCEAVDGLAAVEPATLADGESVRALHRQVERLKAVAARAAAAFEAGRGWEADGARSAASWIATRCPVSLAAAKREVRVGRALRHLPATERAWLAGEIGEGHVEALVAAAGRVGMEAVRADEEELVGRARGTRVGRFVRLLAYWEQEVDPDGAEDRAHDQRESRRLHLSQSFEGMWFLDGVLDPISGEIVSTTLAAIERELFEADWAAAKAIHGRRTCAAHLSRTPAQRRHDALVEMARRARSGATGRPARPLFTVLVGYETLAGRVCELASGTVVTPGSLVPWLSEADVERVVFDGPDRVKNVGPRRRLFSGATRRAVLVRDRECYSEFCDVPAEDCQVDHVQPYGSGGPTVDGNGRAACAYHNRNRHRPP